MSLLRNLLLPCLALLLSGCSHLGQVALSDLAADSDNAIHSPAGQKIDGYTKTDRVYYQYHGYVRFDGPDSLRFSPVQFEMEGKTEDPPPPGADRFTLPAAEVTSLNLD